MTATTEKPVHLCDACGTLNEEAAARIAALEEQVAVLSEDVGSLERELRGKRAQIKRLKADSDAAIKNDPRYATAIVVLKHWKKACAPNARELGGKRLENCIARLKKSPQAKEGYTAEELMRAVDGYALKPYMVNFKRSHVGTQEDWKADAEFIFRDPQKVDAGIRIAERADDLRQTLRTPASPGAETGGAASGSAGPALSSLGQAACSFASRGWLVFPLRRNSKEPATRNGLNDAKVELPVIEATWRQHPSLNVGIRCGRESGLIVLDVDGDDGMESLRKIEQARGKLPLTASVRTPRGGQHFYFQHPGFEVSNSVGWPGPGLDIRGDGGYVVAPPSYVLDPAKGIDGSYQVDEEAEVAPLPDYFVAALKKRATAKATNIGPARDWGKFISQGSSQGERDNRMTSYVGHLFSHGHEPGEVLEAAKVLNAAKVKPPLKDRDLERIVSSIARTRVRRAS
jgi:hypothetical protein